MSSQQSSTAIEIKSKRDANIIFGILKSHNNYDDVVSMFKKGPPLDKGFAWCSYEPGWWSKDESDAIKEVQSEVLKRGWDSSGFCFMMRLIQRIVLFDTEVHAIQNIIETKCS